MDRRHMVALGSSFAAGPRIEPIKDRAAGRSTRNYPHLVAAGLGAQLVDATVSGATTATILETSQRAGRRVFAPQIAAVSADTDLVTVTVGGNDLGYLGGVMSTALLQQLWRRGLTRPVARSLRARRPLVAVTAQQQESATTGLTRIVEAVRARAPGARVVLVDYLPIFTDGFVPGASGRFRTGEVDHFRGVASALTDAFRTAADRSGADLVPASDFAQNHGVGSADPWIRGPQPVRRMGSSFHPNAAGMAAVADVVLEHVQRTARAGRPAPAGPA